MLEAKLTIEIPGLASALESLASALLDGKAIAGIMTAAKGQRGEAAATPGSMTSYTPAPPSPQPPVNYVLSPSAAPTAPAPGYTPGPAPTAPPPGYTHEQVGKAGADLIAADQARMPDLLALLQQFGVPAITELKPEQLGPFATALRGLGAKI